MKQERTVFEYDVRVDGRNVVSGFRYSRDAVVRRIHELWLEFPAMDVSVHREISRHKLTDAEYGKALRLEAEDSRQKARAA